MKYMQHLGSPNNPELFHNRKTVWSYIYMCQDYQDFAVFIFVLTMSFQQRRSSTPSIDHHSHDNNNILSYLV